jgi:hypothetical protein
MARSRGFTRRGRKYRKTKRNTMSRKGVTLAFECGGTCNAKRCAYVGHYTTPGKIVRKMFWRSLLKRLFEKVYSYSPNNLLLPITLQPLDNVELRYRRNTNSGAFEVIAYQATVTPGSGVENSIDTVAAYFADDGLPINNSSKDTSLELVDLSFYPSTAQGTRCRIRLLDAVVHLYSKSTLKLQNRTINALGTEADEVDNVPIYGKSYAGSGAGATWKGDAVVTNANGADFVADKNFGVILEAVNTTGYNGLQEPPLPGDFSHVQKSGKVRLDPGDIKTSSLSSNNKMDLNKFYRRVANIDAASQYVKTDLGQYRFFAMEKMIDSFQTADQPSIIVAYEHNIRMQMTVSEKYTTNTVQLFESAAFSV